MNPLDSPVERDIADVPALEPQAESRPRESAASTVGTGSVLGIGCVLALVVFLIVAVATRWLMGGW